MLPQGYSHFHFIISTLFISSRRRFSHRLFTITHSTLNAFFISSPIQPYRRCLWMPYRQRVSLRRIYIPCVTQLCVYMHMCMYIYSCIQVHLYVQIRSMHVFIVCMYLPILLLSKTNQFYNNVFYKYNFFQSIFSTCLYTVYTYMCTCIYISNVRICVSARMYVCIHLQLHVRMCLCIYIYAYLCGGVCFLFTDLHNQVLLSI